MTKTSRDVLSQLGILSAAVALMFCVAALNAKSLPQAVVTESGIENAMIAEPGAIRDGLPVGVSLARYSVTTGKVVTIYGKPITTFCKSAGFPSHQIRCRDTASPFDLNVAGTQQAVRLGPWYTAS
jgi:hypothetical protein